ncbi:hypothetical protein GHT06_022215 [Daphnia sinensis]|uniref:Uncharacterized protein n=1 Tax=Daphnia sinensis TaxID=1820382 RepID=A0AAD5PP96_9CRUS|nr:hypothetical protein GHT06_022215 [Daphnia sinensis]
MDSCFGPCLVKGTVQCKRQADIVRLSRRDLLMLNIARDLFENSIWLSRFIELEKFSKMQGLRICNKICIEKSFIVAFVTFLVCVFFPCDSTYDLIDRLRHSAFILFLFHLTVVGPLGRRGLNVRQLASQTRVVVGLKNGLDCARIQRPSTAAALVLAPMFKKAIALLFVQVRTILVKNETYHKLLGHRDSIIDLKHLICCCRCNFVVCRTVE